jgi:AcrB/AcrD/AcrF family
VAGGLLAIALSLSAPAKSAAGDMGDKKDGARTHHVTAIYGDRPGQEIEFPMAVVILGGLLTSTALNLFVVPTLYLWIGRPRPARIRPRPAS